MDYQTKSVILETVLIHDGEGSRRWSLVTRDAHGLYEQFGFVNLADSARYMEIVDSAVGQKC